MRDVRNLDDIVTATAPRVRMATLVLQAAMAGAATLVIIAAAWDQHVMDRAETALWTVSGPPCQRIAPVSLRAVPALDPGPLAFEQAQGAFLHGGVVCTVLDRHRGREARSFTVCQFGSPYVVQLATPHGEVFFAPFGKPATISWGGGDPHCVLGVNFPAALFDS
jgi:hypothetical protein